MNRGICTVVAAVLACMVGVAQAAPGKSADPSGTNGNPYKGGNPFTSIKAETTELFAHIDSLYASVNSLEERVTIAEENIADLEATAVDLQQQILANDGDIETLEAELKITNQTIYKLQMDLKQLQSLIEMKQDIIQGKCPNGEYLAEIRPDGSIVCRQDVGAKGITRFSVYTEEYLKDCLCWPGQSCSCPNRPSGTIRATCPANSTAIGGGHTADASVNVTFSGIRGNSWEVDAGLYPLFLYGGGWVRVTATCLRLD